MIVCASCIGQYCLVVNNINLTKLTTRTPHAIAAINYCLHHLYTGVSCATAALPTMSANCIPSELVVCRAVTRPLFFHTGVARARLKKGHAESAFRDACRTSSGDRGVDNFFEVEGGANMAVYSQPKFGINT